MTQVNDIGFTEFTSGLVSSTFETLTSVALTQLKAYSELVASTSKTLAEYKKDTFGTDPEGSDAGAEKVRNDWIQENLVDTGLLKPDDADLSNATPFTADAEDAPQLAQIFGDIKVGADDFVKALGSAPHKVTSETLHDFVGQKLAQTTQTEQDLLITILKIGMQKLVVTDGRIRTKLTFKVSATESRAEAGTSVSSKSQNFSAGLAFRKKALGASASYGRTQYTVNVVNESSYGVINVNAEIIGEVEIRFRTETFPQVDPKALGEAA
jgi:hypothetical protein